MGGLIPSKTWPRKIFSSVLVVLAGTLFLIPSFAFAANLWTYEEDFNDFTVGDLTGQDSWTNDNGIPQVTTDAAALYEGTKGVKFDGSTGNHYTNAKKTLSGSVESGTVYFSVKITNDDNIVALRLYDSTGVNVYFYFWLDGDFQFYNGVTQVDTGVPYSASQWYRVGIQFETSNNAYEGLGNDKWKYSVNGGSWSSEYSFFSGGGSGLGTSITRFDVFGEFDITNTGIMYFDLISPDFSSTSTISTTASTTSFEIYAVRAASLLIFSAVLFLFFGIFSVFVILRLWK